MALALEFLAVAAAMAVLDVVWARYTRTAAQGKRLQAASWAASMPVLSGVVTVAYVGDHRMLAACVVGSFCGTYFGVGSK